MTKFVQNAGKYRHPITFQKQSTTKNEYGERINVWTDYATSRAGFSMISGKENVNSLEIMSEITHKLTIRYMPNITSDLRISYNNKYYKILSVHDYQEMHKEIQLLVKEYS
jgi:SPP1 family predicted phage head-tail adaptor